MAIGMDIIEFFNRAIARTLGDIHGRRMAELGDQKLWGQIALKESGKRVWAKDWFEARGCHHYTIDIHGQNGAHPLDLSKPITDLFWHNNFDIVTNFGTSEHVEDQFECWRNIHNLGRCGCVYVHAVPELGKHNPAHAPHLYTKDFFTNLIKVNKYTPILLESLAPIAHIGVCYIKPWSLEFRPAKEVLQQWIK